MRGLIEEIEKAKEEEIEILLRTVLSRYSALYPLWEISTVSILKCEDRNEQLDKMIRVLQKMKTP